MNKNKKVNTRLNKIDYLISNNTINKSISLLLILAMLFFSFIPEVLAADLNSQKQNVSAEIKQNEQKVKELDAQTKNISNEALKIQNEIDSKENELNKLESEASDLTTDIESMEKQAGEIKTKQEKNKELLKKRLRAMYMNGNLSYMEMLLASNNVLDFVSSYHLVKEITKMDKTLITNAEQEKQKLDTLSVELETKKKTIKEKEQKISSVKKENEVLKKKKDEEVAKLTEEGKQAAAKIDELKKEEQKISNEIAAYERRKREEIERRKKAQAGKGSSSSNTPLYEKYVGGKFGWPVPGDYNVGTRYGAAGRYWSSGYHTGIDIPGSYGTRIVAANDGIVVSAGFNKSYGNNVILDHGGGLYTLYAHGSKLLVSAGQTVKRGEAILAMGETGNAYGVHLHFEVRKGSPYYSSHVDPAPYLGM